MEKNARDKTALVEALPHACTDEAVAVAFLEAQRWGEGPYCAHCGSVAVYRMESKATRPRWLWRCKDCGKQYTVRVGTVMEESRIPLRHWVHAFWRIAASKKGVSALQIKRETGLSYKSALYLLHRVRLAMRQTPGGPKMRGTLEVDETYVGGKERNKHRQGYQPPRTHLGKGGIPRKNVGRGADKAAVYAILERDGRGYAAPMERITAATLRAALFEQAQATVRVHTDESTLYANLGRHVGGHETVKHSNREYVRGDVTTNRVEGFFALLKRGVYGTYHSVSRNHLHRSEEHTSE